MRRLRYCYYGSSREVSRCYYVKDAILMLPLRHTPLPRLIRHAACFACDMPHFASYALLLRADISRYDAICHLRFLFRAQRYYVADDCSPLLRRYAMPPLLPCRRLPAIYACR